MAPNRSSDVLTPRQLTFIAERLPEPPCALRGRRPYSNLALLPGILRVLRSGCRWRDLDRPGHPSGVTHWRRLRYWYRQTGYRKVWRTLLNILVQGKSLDRSLISLDGTLIPSQEFTEQTGYSGIPPAALPSGPHGRLVSGLRVSRDPGPLRSSSHNQGMISNRSAW